VGRQAFALAFFASFAVGNRSDIHDLASTTLGNDADRYNGLKGMVGWALAAAACSLAQRGSRARQGTAGEHAAAASAQPTIPFSPL